MRALVEGSRVQEQGAAAAGLDAAPLASETTIVSAGTGKGRQDLDMGCRSVRCLRV